MPVLSMPHQGVLTKLRFGLTLLLDLPAQKSKMPEQAEQWNKPHKH
jgi:hypothetical protein